MEGQPHHEQPLEPEISSAELQAKCDEYLANWKRAGADYENLKKQLAREKDEYVRYAALRSIETFLPAIDHFAEAARHEPTEQNWKQWAQGVKFIGAEFATALKELGIEKMEIVGKQFDPALHETVGARHEEGKPAGVILEERQAGFMMQGKVLRPAKVIINE